MREPSTLESEESPADSETTPHPAAFRSLADFLADYEDTVLPPIDLSRSVGGRRVA